MVTAAVVPIVTVTDWPLLPETCTDEGKLHVGAGLTTGLMLQLRFTVPVNDPDGINIKLNFALCPALTVCEAGCPGAGPMAKSGAAVATPDKETVCGLPAALSLIATVPVRVPATVGLNVTVI